MLFWVPPRLRAYVPFEWPQCIEDAILGLISSHTAFPSKPSASYIIVQEFSDFKNIKVNGDDLQSFVNTIMLSWMAQCLQVYSELDSSGPLPCGDLLLVIDRYSRYPEVEIVRSTKSSVAIPKLDKIVAAHGIPFELTFDN